MAIFAGLFRIGQATAKSVSSAQKMSASMGARFMRGQLGDGVGMERNNSEVTYNSIIDDIRSGRRSVGGLDPDILKRIGGEEGLKGILSGKGDDTSPQSGGKSLNPFKEEFYERNNLVKKTNTDSHHEYSYKAYNGSFQVVKSMSRVKDVKEVLSKEIEKNFKNLEKNINDVENKMGSSMESESYYNKIRDNIRDLRDYMEKLRNYENKDNSDNVIASGGTKASGSDSRRPSEAQQNARGDSIQLEQTRTGGRFDSAQGQVRLEGGPEEDIKELETDESRNAFKDREKSLESVKKEFKEGSGEELEKKLQDLEENVKNAENKDKSSIASKNYYDEIRDKIKDIRDYMENYANKDIDNNSTASGNTKASSSDSQRLSRAQQNARGDSIQLEQTRKWKRGSYDLIRGETSTGWIENVYDPFRHLSKKAKYMYDNSEMPRSVLKSINNQLQQSNGPDQAVTAVIEKLAAESGISVPDGGYSVSNTDNSLPEGIFNLKGDKKADQKGTALGPESKGSKPGHSNNRRLLPSMGERHAEVSKLDTNKAHGVGIEVLKGHHQDTPPSQSSSKVSEGPKKSELATKEALRVEKENFVSMFASVAQTNIETERAKKFGESAYEKAKASNKNMSDIAREISDMSSKNPERYDKFFMHLKEQKTIIEV